MLRKETDMDIDEIRMLDDGTSLGSIWDYFQKDRTTNVDLINKLKQIGYFGWFGEDVFSTFCIRAAEI